VHCLLRQGFTVPTEAAWTFDPNFEYDDFGIGAVLAVFAHENVVFNASTFTSPFTIGYRK
jgi:hypothetical protein